MGLFKEPLNSLASYLEDARSEGTLREYTYNQFAVWPEKRSLVLQDNTAVELGSSGASLFMILWTGQSSVLRPNQISLIGPDITETEQPRIPFAKIVLVKGHFQDEYDTYRDLRDRVFDTKPEGVSTRIWPDRQKVWCRVSREAVDKGFDLVRYGSTIIKRLNSLDAVEESEVIFVTLPPEEPGKLKPVAEKVQDIVEALIKMYEEMNFDCEECEYNDVCEEVEALREIRERLRKERNQT